MKNVAIYSLFEKYYFKQHTFKCDIKQHEEVLGSLISSGE